MGRALSLKILSWLSYLDHQAINTKDFEFLSQLLKKNQRGSCDFWLLCGFGFEAIIDPQEYPFSYFCCFIQAMVSLFFEDMSNKAPNKDFFLAILVTPFSKISQMSQKSLVNQT